jgi:hypothetical protein
MSIYLKIYENKYVNLKLFNNGSIHLTGCKTL